MRFIKSTKFYVQCGLHLLCQHTLKTSSFVCKIAANVNSPCLQACQCYHNLEFRSYEAKNFIILHTYSTSFSFCTGSDSTRHSRRVKMVILPKSHIFNKLNKRTARTQSDDNVFSYHSE